jgi:hypothetical protein
MVYVIFKQFFCNKVSKIGHSILFKNLFGDTFDTLINSYINLPLHGGHKNLTSPNQNITSTNSAFFVIFCQKKMVNPNTNDVQDSTGQVASLV